ncbi:FUSC family protein [Chelatococcus sambhunathii]|uniref:FUSC family protein n=1 Tax=Chelatococcus sambhunathii TaxID=363953 RepID=A0ABU1DJA6_9HYPH|nr:FUSC family protein [Chelatococcus sambhunathii]MDR4308202.1 FUSC family protein [Chelatococcus sambhunathii]
MPFSLPDRHAADIRLAAKVAAATGGAFVLATVLGLPQGYWSVISALVVVQGSVGGTLAAAQERAIGTVVGAAVGGLAAYLHPHSLLTTSVTLTMVTAALAFAAAGRPSLKLAPVTAAILLVATANQPNQLAIAAERVLEVTLGCLVGVAATFLVFPNRLDREIAREGRTIAAELAALLRGAPARRRDPEAAHLLLGAQDSIRRKLAAFEKTVADARRAPGARAAAEARSALSRALWRVRNDAVAMERALSAAPDAARQLVGPTADALILACADLLDALATGDDPGPGREEVASRRAALDEAVLHLGDEAEAEHVDVADAVPTIGLVFALRNLSGNLFDLADRLGEAKDAALAE